MAMSREQPSIVDIEAGARFVYKAPKLFLVIPLLALGTSLYMVSFQLGLLAPILPWSVTNPRPPLSPIVFCFGIAVMGLFLYRMRAAIDRDGILYRGPFVSRRVHWEDIVSVEAHYPRGPIVIGTGERRYRLVWQSRRSNGAPLPADLEGVLAHYCPEITVNGFDDASAAITDGQTETYGFSAMPAVLGILGALFWLYVLCYNAGWVDGALFPKVGEFSLEKTGMRAFLWLAFGFSGVLVATARLRLKLSEDGLTYRGLVRTVRMKWPELERVRYSRRLQRLSVRTSRARVCIPEGFSRKSKAAILREVRAKAPNAVIEETDEKHGRESS